jgi:hypothetical protein
MKKAIGVLGAGLLASAIATGANAAGQYTLDVDVTGWSDGDFIVLNLGSYAEVTGIGWNVTMTADDDGAWLSDGRFEFGPDGAPWEVALTPGVGNNGPGTMTFTGGVKLADVGIPDIVIADGQFLIYYNSFGWNCYVADGDPMSSYLTIQYNAIVPAPGALALLGLAGLAGTTRRRRA